MGLDHGRLWQDAPEEYRAITTHIVCNNPLSYEEILNWRGFSFESSHTIDAAPIRNIGALLIDVENMLYGMEESERIINNVLSKQKGY